MTEYYIITHNYHSQSTQNQNCSPPNDLIHSLYHWKCKLIAELEMSLHGFHFWNLVTLVSESNSILLLHWKGKMGQYSTVVSLATENRSCVYVSELLVSNIPFLYLSLLSFGLNMTSLSRSNSCCCLAAPQTPYGQEKWTQRTQPTLQGWAPRSAVRSRLTDTSVWLQHIHQWGSPRQNPATYPHTFTSHSSFAPGVSQPFAE